MHWNGSGWSSQPSPVDPPTSIHKLGGSPGGNTWVLTNQDAFFRWDGSTWLPIAAGAPAGIRDFLVTSATDVWAVSGDGALSRWDGNQWNVVTGSAAPSGFDAWLVTANDVWLAPVFGSGQNGLWHWNGSNWTIHSHPLAGSVRKVLGKKSNDVWFTTASQKLLHWDGVAVSTVDTQSSSTDIRAVWSDPSGTTWAAGVEGELLRKAP